MWPSRLTRCSTTTLVTVSEKPPSFHTGEATVADLPAVVEVNEARHAMDRTWWKVRPLLSSIFSVWEIKQWNENEPTLVTSSWQHQQQVLCFSPVMQTTEKNPEEKKKKQRRKASVSPYWGGHSGRPSSWKNLKNKSPEEREKPKKQKPRRKGKNTPKEQRPRRKRGVWGGGGGGGTQRTKAQKKG